MKVNISNITTIELNEQDIEDIIKEYFESNGYEIVGNINFLLEKKQWTDGFGLGEIDYEKLTFNGVKADIVKTK